MTEEEVRDLATKLMADHGLSDWELRIGKAPRAAGRCQSHTQAKMLGLLPLDSPPGTITISGVIAARHPGSEVRDTILHEIAHALNPVGVTSHGKEWKAIAVSIGARPERTYTRERPLGGVEDPGGDQ